jgi:hypothetical protein
MLMRADRWRRTLLWAATLVLVAGLTAGVAAELRNAARAGHATTEATGPPGPEGIPLEVGPVLGPESTAATGQTVDGIACDPSEQAVYHIHTHLSVYVNGSLRPIPPGIGVVSPTAKQTANGPFYVATRCYYWLHVHAQDGIIHAESPSPRTYTLGQFFAIWGQPLTAHDVGPVTGTVTVFVNGRRYSGDPAGITLGSHEDIQIDVGRPVVAPQRVDWDKSQL